MGMDSLLAVELKNRIEPALGVSLISTVAFDHPTVRGLSKYLAGELFKWQPVDRVKVVAQSISPGAATAEQPDSLSDAIDDQEIASKLARLEALIRGR
jgi:hypothetical protein